tara:strand:+ start:10045 stop:10710 length:666 start_codon:yes stop_codon:yes gene_type:complete
MKSTLRKSKSSRRRKMKKKMKKTIQSLVKTKGKEISESAGEIFNSIISADNAFPLSILILFAVLIFFTDRGNAFLDKISGFAEQVVCIATNSSNEACPMGDWFKSSDSTGSSIASSKASISDKPKPIAQQLQNHPTNFKINKELLNDVFKLMKNDKPVTKEFIDHTKKFYFGIYKNDYLADGLKVTYQDIHPYLASEKDLIRDGVVYVSAKESIKRPEFLP